MPMTATHVFMILSGVLALMFIVNWILGKVKKDWKPTAWEILEEEERDQSLRN